MRVDLAGVLQEQWAFGLRFNLDCFPNRLKRIFWPVLFVTLKPKVTHLCLMGCTKWSVSKKH